MTLAEMTRAQKVAHILIAMEPAYSERLLGALTPHEAGQVRAWIEQMNGVSPEAVRACLIEFLACMGSEP